MLCIKEKSTTRNAFALLVYGFDRNVTCLYSSKKDTCSGDVTDSWDDVEDLAQTLDVLMDGDISEAEDVDVDDPDAVNLYLAGYNSRHGTIYCRIMDENTFRSMIPFSAYTGEPDLDLEFKRTVRGDVKSLISALSKAEDDLLAQSNELWNQLNSALGVEVVE